MPDELGNFHEDSLDDLVRKMWRFSVGDLRYTALRGELDRRVAISQIDAAKAQTRSARFQLLAVVAMFLAVVATLVAPWLSRISS
jgi:hypothetical protein